MVAREASVSDEQALGERTVDRADKPRLLLMKGPPGSGKSTLARALSRRLGWPLVDKDDARDLMDDSNPGLAYDIMLNVGRRQLLQDLSVICDSPLGYRRTYERAAEIAHETRASLAVVECLCPDETIWRRRVESRQGLSLPAHHTTDWIAVQAYQQRTAGDAGYPITHPHLVIDTNHRVSELCDRVVRWLKSPGEAEVRCAPCGEDDQLGQSQGTST